MPKLTAVRPMLYTAEFDATLGFYTDILGFKLEVRLDEFGWADLSRDRIEDLRTELKEGEDIEVMIINVDRKTRSISLSVKAKDQVEQKEAMQKLAADNSASSGTTNLGALLKAKLNQN